MFKFVVLCAFFAVAAAKPGVLFPTGITEYSTVLSPGTTTISKQDSSIIHPSSIEYYSTPALAYAHLIKKRSAPLAYIAPTTYIAPNPYVAAAPLQTTLVSGSPILPAVAPIAPAIHLIKKRSAPLLPTTYFAPQTIAAAPAPILTTSYTSAAPLIPTASLISQPLTYTHLIKKRSADLFNTYVAPASFSQQSRFDLKTTHNPLTSIVYDVPATYSSPLYSHVY